ncbi:MAG: hypothetical protein BWX99_02989 [Deltaproteobacteria bacterium ADurb.Bin151]|nr:MAG: hypothetical protein BWX99_02989 [Deltaproteobacteria bacterium ADurb.Bin151]
MSSRTHSNSGCPGVTHSNVGSVVSNCLSKTICLYSFPSLPQRGSSCSPICQRFLGMRPTRYTCLSFAISLGWIPACGAALVKKSSITSGTRRRSLASADLPTIAERFNSFLASPSRVELVICLKRFVSISWIIRFLMTSSVRLWAYISRSMRSSKLAGKTSPKTLNIFPVRCGSRSSSIFCIRSNSFCSTRPSRVLVVTKLKMRQSFSCP